MCFSYNSAYNDFINIQKMTDENININIVSEKEMIYVNIDNY